jgi:hypothetical protein
MHMDPLAYRIELEQLMEAIKRTDENKEFGVLKHMRRLGRALLDGEEQLSPEDYQAALQYAGIEPDDAAFCKRHVIGHARGRRKEREMKEVADKGDPIALLEHLLHDYEQMQVPDLLDSEEDIRQFQEYRAYHINELQRLLKAHKEGDTEYLAKFAWEATSDDRYAAMTTRIEAWACDYFELDGKERDKGLFVSYDSEAVTPETTTFRAEVYVRGRSRDLEVTLLEDGNLSIRALDQDEEEE